MIFSKKLKTQRLPKTHKKQKKLKNHLRRHHMKKIRKQTVVGIDKY